METLDPAAAAPRLAGGELHAYVDGDPFAGRALPAGLASAASLESYLVVSFDPAAGPPGPALCARARQVAASLRPGDYAFHPYPVTPYDADYLDQFDLAAAARPAYATGGTGEGPPLRIRARGALAERILDPRARAAGEGGDATLEQVDLTALLAGHRTSLNGWAGPPWIKAGWFHAYLLLADAVREPSARRAADTAYRRLVAGEYGPEPERLGLERALVSRLTAGCERVVLGYTVRREDYSTDYTAGVENVAWDSLDGFDAPIFLRTVKLKDFPWNGWLRLGVGSRPAAAWNPVAGFTDPGGRLVWAAVGDPAMLSAPYGASWIAGRVEAAPAAPGGVEVPEGALVPEPGTGALRRVGPGVTARVELVYRARMSRFHDGTRMTVADVISPYVFAYRWGGSAPGAPAHDPDVAAASALAREWLAGLRIVKVDTVVRNLGEDLKLTYEVPVVEVYLRHALGDPQAAASVAPPWSAVPWTVTALMEEAVARGLAAFSAGEARRRDLPWLDLARDRTLGEELAGLVERFAREGYVPAALARFVTAAEARERWVALARFHRAHGHFLVTNGPYRLARWSPDAVTLEVVRDFSYPLGVGSFDHHAIPRRAFVTRVDDRGDRLVVQADVETVSKFQRSYAIVRKPLAQTADEEERVAPVCRWVVVDAAGGVRAAGTAVPGPDARFTVDLGGRLAPGLYTVMLAVSLGDNAVAPAVQTIHHRVRA